MRWKWKKKQRLKEGDRRIMERFLLFPKRLNGEWRWLEIARICQQYRVSNWLWPDIPTLWDWVDLHWANLDEPMA